MRSITGDGAGISYNCPTNFFSTVFEEHNIQLPNSGDYGVGFFFLSNDEGKYATEIQLSILFKELNLELLILEMFLNSFILGKVSADCEPKCNSFSFHDLYRLCCGFALERNCILPGV